MKLNLSQRILLLAALWFTSTASAQLVIDNSLTPAQLAQLISGNGVQILNPQVHGAVNSFGKYNATNSNLNISEGLLLTTGQTADAVGPNNMANQSSYSGDLLIPDTYPMLTTYTGRTIFEYTEFEFDIIPQGDTLNFDFVFASEEYEEWVGSQFNDVFGFFISGPGIIPDANAGIYKNIALIPNSNTPVTINSVNQLFNSQYYVNNTNGQSVQYDGFTTGLKAISAVQPCQVYHLKLIVADASDKLWDSGVFIEKIASNGLSLTSNTAGGIQNMVEGCNYGTITFSRQVVTSQPLTIEYWVDGTATNGTDYPLIGTSASPAVPKYITIPANQASASITVNAYADALPEGYEYIMIYLGNPYCSNAIMDSLKFYIMDSLYTEVVRPGDTICSGSSYQINVAGGGTTFSWSPTTGLSNPNIKDPIASPTVTTTYTLTTTASNCTYTVTATVNVRDLAIALSSTNVSCSNANNGSAIVTASSGVGAYTYSWTGPNGFTSSNDTITNLSPGTYSVTVQDDTCSVTGSVTILQPSTLTAAVSAQTNNSCFGGNAGSATVTVTGGTAPYTYSWNSTPVQTTATASGLAAGNYTVTVTDAGGCTATATVTITQPLIGLTANIIAQTNNTCFLGNTGTATVLATGGALPYSYSWSTSPVQTTPVATNLSAGTYTVTVTDANGCTATDIVTITEPASGMTATITAQTDVVCFGGNTGSATVSVSGGTAPYTYVWSTIPVQTTPTATNLTAGTYTVTVLDANLCSTTQTVTIAQPALALSINVTALTNPTCFGDTTGSVSVVATGGTGPYTYTWNTVPVQITGTLTGLGAGIYVVTVTDANGCTAFATITITGPLFPLTADATAQNNVSCFGGNNASAIVNVEGGNEPYTYSWSTSPAQTGATATNLSAGTYTVTVTDSTGCTAIDSVTITQPAAALSASITAQVNTSCNNGNGGSATVTATGGTAPFTYSWNTTPVQTSATATNLSAGTYIVTVTDANGCTATATATITQPSSAITATISAQTNISCFGDSTGSATITATGGTAPYTYSWNITPVQTTATATGLTAGVYTATVQDSAGCVTTVTVTITQPAAITVSLASPTYSGGYNIGCHGDTTGTINVTVNGGNPAYTYAWTGPNGQTGTGSSYINAGAGTYTVVVTDANGCSASGTITLTEPSFSVSGTLTPQLYPGGQNISCFGGNNGSIDLATSGGTQPYTFAWTGPNGFTASTEDISSLYAGTYDITITDANGCQLMLSMTLTEPAQSLAANFAGNWMLLCNADTTGNIDISINGGTGGCTFVWTGPNNFGATTEDVINLGSGEYVVVVTDTNGCTFADTVEITEPDALVLSSTLSAYNGVNISCPGSTDGHIDVTLAGGTSGFMYSWTGPNGFTAGSEDISNLGAGIYTLMVTDTNGCSAMRTDTLREAAPLAAATAVTAASCGSNNGTIDLMVTGGIPPYAYAWSNGSTQEDLSGLSAGTYVVIVTDANGCTVTSDTAVINNSAPIVFTGNTTNVNCYGDATGSITLSIQNDFGYTFSWTSGDTTQNLSGIGAGTYIVTVTDTAGCTAVDTFVVSQPQELTVTLYSETFANGFNVSGYDENDGSIDLTVAGGTSPYSYLWSTGETTEDISSLTAGSYSVIVTDQNGCQDTGMIDLKEPLTLEMPTGYSPNGDGQNDFFVVRGLENFPNNRIEIYNRWGNLVYEQNNYTNQWNGRTSGGDELPDATYFVVLTVNNGDITLKNYVDLRR
jgi:gliding motility-associated-like protein